MSSGALTRNAVADALAGYTHMCRLHDGSSPQSRTRTPARGRERRSRRRDRQPYRVASPNEFELDKFANPERLHAIFKILASEGGHGPGIDGVTYTDIGPSDVYKELRSLRTRILAHVYCPEPTRLVRIPKGDGRFRELQLNCILDRVVAKALQVALDEYWRTQLPRLGRDVWCTYAEMQRVMRQQKAYVLAIDDVRDCFPSTPLEPVLDCHRQHITQPDLLWLIETIVRGHDGPAHTTGLHQGSPYSPVAMELLLHNQLDTRLEAMYRGYPLLLRYVDNINVVCSSEREGRDFLQLCTTILNEIGLRLKSAEGPPLDIRDQHDRVVLGLIPRWLDGGLSFTVPETGFEDLEHGLAEATTSIAPLAMTLDVICGWLNAVGPALTTAVRLEVVGRVINMARRCGFSELRREDLLDVGRRARARWMTMSEGRER